jgi:hypothetical protein
MENGYNGNMEQPIIDFAEFELSFVSESSSTDDAEISSEADLQLLEDEELDNEEIRQQMEVLIPKEAIYVGRIDAESENWTTWCIHDEYYIRPLHDSTFDWALFRISWDDNWECWNWSFDARLIGFKDSFKDAAKFVLPKLWESWQIDLNSGNSEVYRELLNNL